MKIPQREGGANSLKYPNHLGSYCLGDRNNQIDLPTLVKNLNKLLDKLRVNDYLDVLTVRNVSYTQLVGGLCTCICTNFSLINKMALFIIRVSYEYLHYDKAIGVIR